MIKEFYVRKAALDMLQDTNDLQDVGTHLTKRMVDENSIACVVRGNDPDTIYWKNLADGTREYIVKVLKALGLTNFEDWGLRQAAEKLGQFARREKERADMNQNVSGEYHVLADTVRIAIYGEQSLGKYTIEHLIEKIRDIESPYKQIRESRTIAETYYRTQDDQTGIRIALSDPIQLVVSRLVSDLRSESEIAEDRDVQIQKARDVLADWVKNNQTSEELSLDPNRENIIRYDLGTSPEDCVRWVLDALAKHADSGVDQEIMRLQGQLVAANRRISAREDAIKRHETTIAELRDEAICLKAQKLGTAEVLRDREDELARERSNVIRLQNEIAGHQETIAAKTRQNVDLAGVNHDLRMLLEPRLDAFHESNGSEAYAIKELYKLAHGHAPGVLTGMKLDDVLTNIRRLILPHRSIAVLVAEFENAKRQLHHERKQWRHTPGEVKNFRCVMTPIVHDETQPEKIAASESYAGSPESDNAVSFSDDLPELPEHDDKVLGIGRVYSEEKMRLFAVSALNHFRDSLVTFIGPKRKL